MKGDDRMRRRSKVSKKIVFGILERALVRGLDSEIIFEEPEFRRQEVFRGPAENWEEFGEKDFQEFAVEHGILSETKIVVADLGAGNFVVIKV